MAISHALHLHRDADVARRGRVAPHFPERSVPADQGGRVLAIAIVIVVVAWVAALSQLFQLSVVGAGISQMQTALWTALGIASGITAFVLGIWKAYRT